MEFFHNGYAVNRKVAQAVKLPAFVLGVLGVLAVQNPADIQVPAGFAVSIWTERAGITAMTYDSNGRMFATSTIGGQIWILEDLDQDGYAETSKVFAAGLEKPLGLAFAGDDLYVASRGRVSRLRDTDGDDTADLIEDVVTGLPHGVEAAGQEVHQTNGLVLGPDGLIYVSQGGVRNAELETEPLAGTIFTVHPAAGRLGVYADGFRNPYALMFHSQGQLLATDNGVDGLAGLGLAADPPDELNWVQPGKHYGHPYYFDENFPDRPQVPAGLELVPPLVAFPPHTAAVGLAEWVRGDVFVALYSSQQVVRVALEWNDEKIVDATEGPFAFGFKSPLAVSRSLDGQALFVSDYLSGPIYGIRCDRAIVEGCGKFARTEHKLTGTSSIGILKSDKPMGYRVISVAVILLLLVVVASYLFRRRLA